MDLLGFNFGGDVRLLRFGFDDGLWLRLWLRLRLRLRLQLRLWFRWLSRLLLDMDVCLSLAAWSLHPRASSRLSNMDRCSWWGKRRFRRHLRRACSWHNRWLSILRELGVSGPRSSRQRLLYKQLRGIHKLMLQVFLLDLLNLRRWRCGRMHRCMWRRRCRSRSRSRPRWR
jgi:hypothetical protein